jgi:tetratricopeptide (TPR) repeat protein
VIELPRRRRAVLAGLVLLGASAPTLAFAGGGPSAEPTPERGAPASRARLTPLAEPALERQEEGVRAQLRAARGQLDALLAAPATTDGELAEAYGRLGRLYFLYDIVDLTVPALENANLLSPDDYRWPYFLAVHQTFEGDLEGAERSLRRVLELRPGDAPSLVRLANVLLDQGRAGEAEPLYRRAIELPAQRAAALAGLARIASERREHALAIELAEQALALQPAADSLYHLVGLARRELGDREAARVALAKNKHGRVRFEDPLVDGLAAENASAQAHLHAASEAMRRNDLDEAVRFYRSYLALEGDDANVYHNMGVALLSLNRWPEGLDALRRAVALDNGSRSAHFSLGSALAELGRYDEALPHYRRAYEIDPSEKNVHADLATLLAKVGRSDEALAELESILKEDPLHAYARLKYGTVLAQMGRDRDARPHLEAMAESGALGARERAEAHYHLGLLATRRRDAEASRRHLEAAVSLDRKSSEAQRALGEDLAREGRFAEASVALERAVELEPTDERSQFSRAMAYLLGERYPAAAAALEAAVRALPDNIALRHLLARVLATCPEAAVRDGGRALVLAQQVVAAELSFEHVETLAMAFAEAGRYDEAVATQRQVIAHAERVGAASGRAHEQRLERLARYERREPVRAPWRG